ncbi:isoprenylcysteine carboxylmethyltransferase family protein [Thalassomonas viridans]|uniref:Isoprenylcysteine carboxylmethyltransferase family protein n=1 Tax=Thalassomonas viridans TaxID=137584 RepID=A0AAE9Z6V7_9GAMM|nr:isoprenylcysteine carboxylmethyltransferase family protein [Thalassomonas viridans]WDE07100.1 isoprenylcysteine carboxylmethyltransferase family protein [Thalassomonas viridans]
MDVKDGNKGAAVKFPPPLVFLLFMLLGGGINRYWPLAIADISWLKYFGGALAVAGFAVTFHISRAFKRADTSIEPWKPTTAIISSGYFAYSRNPIYSSFCLITVGLGLFYNSVWVLISFLPSAWVVYLLAIKKEEAYLERKFGEQYLAYKKRVRRWL